jgi:hypothetical protein
MSRFWDMRKDAYPENLPVQLIQHPLHLAKRMIVPSPSRAGNAAMQPLNSLIHPLRFRKSLRRHEVPRRVVRMRLQQCVKLRQRRLDLTPIGILHRQPIARKSIVWVQMKNFLKSCDLVHSFLENHNSTARRHCRGNPLICEIQPDCRNWKYGFHLRQRRYQSRCTGRTRVEQPD